MMVLYLICGAVVGGGLGVGLLYWLYLKDYLDG